MRTVIFIMMIMLTCQFAYAGEMVVIDTRKDNPKYELITSVQTGPVGSQGGKMKYRYRAVVTTFEIYDSIFIERLKIKGDKGVPTGIEWTRKIQLKKITDRLKISSEQRKIQIKKWMNPKSLNMEIGGHSLTILDVGLKSITVVILD